MDRNLCSNTYTAASTSLSKKKAKDQAPTILSSHRFQIKTVASPSLHAITTKTKFHSSFLSDHNYTLI